MAVSHQMGTTTAEGPRLQKDPWRCRFLLARTFQEQVVSLTFCYDLCPCHLNVRCIVSGKATAQQVMHGLHELFWTSSSNAGALPYKIQRTALLTGLLGQL